MFGLMLMMKIVLFLKTLKHIMTPWKPNKNNVQTLHTICKFSIRLHLEIFGHLPQADPHTHTKLQLLHMSAVLELLVRKNRRSLASVTRCQLITVLM